MVVVGLATGCRSDASRGNQTILSRTGRLLGDKALEYDNRENC